MHPPPCQFRDLLTLRFPQRALQDPDDTIASEVNHFIRKSEISSPVVVPYQLFHDASTEQATCASIHLLEKKFPSLVSDVLPSTNRTISGLE
jgi:hypothetical protein